MNPLALVARLLARRDELQRALGLSNPETNEDHMGIESTIRAAQIGISQPAIVIGASCNLISAFVVYRDETDRTVHAFSRDVAELREWLPQALNDGQLAEMFDAVAGEYQDRNLLDFVPDTLDDEVEPAATGIVSVGVVKGADAYVFDSTDEKGRTAQLFVPRDAVKSPAGAMQFLRRLLSPVNDHWRTADHTREFVQLWLKTEANG